MKTMTLTSENLGEIISRTFNKDFWKEDDRLQFLGNIRLLIAELDGGCTDLYDEACEKAKVLLDNKNKKEEAQTTATEAQAIIANLNDEQKQLLADTIIHGSWGDCTEAYTIDGKDEECGAYGYIPDDAYRGGHFERKTLGNRFQSLYKALGLEGNKYTKRSSTMVWHYDWWEDGSGSILLIREDLVDDFENWAREYNKR